MTHWMDLFNKGGVIVWILSAYSVLGLSIVLERLIYLSWRGRGEASLEKRVRRAVETGEFDDWSPREPSYSVVSGMLRAAGEGAHDLARVGERLRAVELPRLEHGLATLGLLGNTAPLLGLLGTISGMIKAFMVIEQAGGKVDASALAGGIWEAMLTTGVGLSIAIPLLIALHFLEGMVERRALAMQQSLSLVLEYLPVQADAQSAPAKVKVHHWEALTDE